MTNLTCYDAVKIAAEHIQARGFTRSGRSNVSEAIYLSFPGREGQLRVAAHEMGHSGVIESLDFIYREAWQRDDNDIGLSTEQVIERAEWAIERFLENAEEADDE